MTALIQTEEIVRKVIDILRLKIDTGSEKNVNKIFQPSFHGYSGIQRQNFKSDNANEKQLCLHIARRIRQGFRLGSRLS